MQADSAAKTHWLLSVWLPAGIVLGWESAARLGWLDPLFFPPPTKLAVSAVRMLSEGDLAGQIGSTLGRSFTGFILGTLIGLICGAAMGTAPVVRGSLEPLVSALYSTPKLTLLPMLMLLVGVGETARLLIIGAGCFILVTMHTLDGVSAVSRHYVEMASNYGSTRAMLFRKVYLPACLPHIFTGMRLAAGRALVTTLSVEMISSDDGLGNVILHSWQTFSTERLYIAVVVSAVLGACLHNLLKVTERTLIPWRR